MRSIAPSASVSERVRAGVVRRPCAAPPSPGRNTRSGLTIFLAALLALTCSACQRAADPAPKSAPSGTLAPGAGVDEVSNSQYRYEIRYPPLSTADYVLLPSLRRYAETVKSDFLRNVEQAPETSDAPTPPWQLDLAFDVRSHTPHFVSVVASGSAFTGGAHGNPLLASFVLHRPTGRVIAIGELFGDPDDALRVLGDFARAQLMRRDSTAATDAATQRRIVDGTAPRPENYAVFAVDGSVDDRAPSLLLMFPTYQVAPYAAGVQEVTVPPAIFTALLKPEFREAFGAKP
jgi:hypothetical protein